MNCRGGGGPENPPEELAHRRKRRHLTAVERIVEPEIIDRLPPDHPDARRSRRDLRLINFLMGNERWIARQASGFPEALATGVFEIGAGEGALLLRMAKAHGGIPLKACDLAPRPPKLPERITWDRRDVFESLAESASGVLVANLVLHHFDDCELERLRPHLEKFEVICVIEPQRTPRAIADARWMLPFLGRATRHDMMVSLRAGFLPGELPERLGLAPERWRVQEEISWWGGLRMLAVQERGVARRVHAPESPLRSTESVSLA